MAKGPRCIRFEHETSLTDFVNDYKDDDMLTEILEEAEKKKRLCLRKRWRVEFGGKAIILRALFDKVIAWAGQFRAIIDVTIQSDQPTKSYSLYAVMYWARHFVSSTVPHSDNSIQRLNDFVLVVRALHLSSGLIALMNLKNSSQQPLPEERPQCRDKRPQDALFHHVCLWAKGNFL